MHKGKSELLNVNTQFSLNTTDVLKEGKNSSSRRKKDMSID